MSIVCQCPAVESHMPTRNVVLTDHQALLVERLVASYELMLLGGPG